MENRSVIVVGAGGNIGSHLVPHLGRMPGIGRVTLLDRGRYEARDRVGQDINPGDVGEAKAIVQARRLRRINPALPVTALVDSVEDVPLGLLRGDVLLACLDSRAARRAVNLRVWRLGLPWIDAGVRADGLLARANVHLPGPGQPCLECAWEEDDYRGAAEAYPCAGDDEAAPTNAPSSLGALAAALQAIECRKLLGGRWEQVAVGRQVTISALGHRLFVTRFRPNPHCRFDHQSWQIDKLDRRPGELTLAEALALGRGGVGTGEPGRLRVAEQVFVRKLACPGCGRERDVPLGLLGRLGAAERTCPGCPRRMRASGFDAIEWLCADDVSATESVTPLRRLGLRRGDVLTVVHGARRAHLELGALR